MSVITSNLMIVVIAMILCVSIFGFNTITSLRSPVTKFQRTDLKMAGFNFNFNFSPKVLFFFVSCFNHFAITQVYAAGC